MSPPLKPSGEVVSSVQISASLPFQPSSAFSSVRMIQLSLIENHLHASTGNFLASGESSMAASRVTLAPPWLGVETRSMPGRTNMTSSICPHGENSCCMLISPFISHGEISFRTGGLGYTQQASFVLPNDILAGTAPPSAALSVTAGSIIGSGNNAFLSLVSVPIGALQRVQPPMPPHPAPQSAQIGCLRFAAE